MVDVARTQGNRFGAPEPISAPGENPVVAAAAGGESGALVVWVGIEPSAGVVGAVFASLGSTAAYRFGPPAAIPSSASASTALATCPAAGGGGWTVAWGTSAPGQVDSLHVVRGVPAS